MTTYYPNHLKQQESVVLDNGEQIVYEWYEDGTPKSEKHFKNKDQVGPSIIWDKNCKVKEYINYDNSFTFDARIVKNLLIRQLTNLYVEFKNGKVVTYQYSSDKNKLIQIVDFSHTRVRQIEPDYRIILLNGMNILTVNYSSNRLKFVYDNNLGIYSEITLVKGQGILSDKLNNEYSITDYFFNDKVNQPITLQTTNRRNMATINQYSVIVNDVVQKYNLFLNQIKPLFTEYNGMLIINDNALPYVVDVRSNNC